MKLKFFCPLWGSEALPFNEFCRRVKTAGYNGVEISFEQGRREETGFMVKALADAGLEFIAQHWQTINPEINAHAEEYRGRLEWLAETRPLFINTQTGKDWFTFEDNRRMIAIAAEIAATAGVRILHETHRGKFSFCAEAAKRFLEADPGLRLTADFSHWCNVSESLLEDQEEALALAIERADHIHARIGFMEGPQVPDFRAPEWNPALRAHLQWWDRIVRRHAERGSAVFTITPEFGPFPYMPVMPFSAKPVSNQWELNVAMMNLLKERYADICEVTG